MEIHYVWIVVIVIAAILIISSEWGYSSTTVTLGDKTVNVEIADTVLKRMKGLIGHAPLQENDGMLFVTESEEHHGIWMMNMSFPIDIIWIDRDLKINHIVENAPPCIVNCTVYRPTSKSLYVLEVQSGFVERNKVEIGDDIKIRWK